MNRKESTSQVILKFVIAVIIAIYVLFPFALVVINSCKQTADITSNPIGLNGMSKKKFIGTYNISDTFNKRPKIGIFLSNNGRICCNSRKRVKFITMFNCR